MFVTPRINQSKWTKKALCSPGSSGKHQGGGGGCAQGNLSLIPVPVGKGGLLVPPRRF